MMSQNGIVEERHSGIMGKKNTPAPLNSLAYEEPNLI